MNKKILAVCIVGLFLLTGLTILPASGMKTNVETEPEPNEGAYLLINVYGKGPWGQTIAVPGVKVTIQKKDNPLIKRTSFTGPLGVAGFLGLPYGTYYLTMRYTKYGLNTEIEFNARHTSFSFSIDDDFTKSGKHIETLSLLENIFARFPLLQQLLNLA